MAQHFLMSAKARTLSPLEVAQWTDEKAEMEFAMIRWPDTNGAPVCPKCGSVTVYEMARTATCPKWRCARCRKDFSLTSGTMFHSRKMTIKKYLIGLASFVNEVKGKSALALGRDIDVQYKTAFVLEHKLREAMGHEIHDVKIGGEGKVAEVDGAYFGGYVKQENEKADRVDRRLAVNQTGKRQCVVAIRERGGPTAVRTGASEESALAFIRSTVNKGTVMHADESGAWDSLHARFEMKRVNHSERFFGPDEACSNNAESFFSRMRRAEIGHHHHIAGPYLNRYAREMAFREDHKADDNRSQFRRVGALVATHRPSIDFCGYWQRANRSDNGPKGDAALLAA